MIIYKQFGKQFYWFGERLEDRYTSEFAEVLKAEVEQEVSLNLGKKDRNRIISRFERDDFVLIGKSSYLHACYGVANTLLASNCSKPGRYSGERIDACSRLVGFVEELCQHSELTPQLLEKNFTRTYRTVEQVLDDSNLIWGWAPREEDSLFIKEKARIDKRFFPKAFGQVLGDMYR